MIFKIILVKDYLQILELYMYILIHVAYYKHYFHRIKSSVFLQPPQEYQNFDSSFMSVLKYHS